MRNLRINKIPVNIHTLTAHSLNKPLKDSLNTKLSIKPYLRLLNRPERTKSIMQNLLIDLRIQITNKDIGTNIQFLSSITRSFIASTVGVFEP